MSADATAAPSREEGLVEIDDELHYAVADPDRLGPFLMSVLSDGDRWMFVSSRGPLTAGRRDSGLALFPYETDDRLHAAVDRLGPLTRCRVEAAGDVVTWRPFGEFRDAGARRVVAKTVIGDSVVFRERHDRLGLVVAHRWSSTEAHGFVRTSTLTNDGPRPVRIELVDGLVGLLPYGLEPTVYQRLSNLSNAYKRSELIDPGTRLAVYSLESPVSDQAEPEEVLRATVVWSRGLDDAEVVLDADLVSAFDAGTGHPTAGVVTGRPGAYLLRATIELAPGATRTWRIVADVGRDQADVAELRRALRQTPGGDDVDAGLDTAVRATAARLERIMVAADALQRTGDPIACAHHYANVTYNVMRGGVPLAGYRVDTADFAAFVEQRNRTVAGRRAGWFGELPSTLERRELDARIAAVDDVHLTRLGREYLPFSFSRRHGDPSRPWNRFSIRVRDEAGRPVIYFEGNWRDVFQNWEALCASFPEYLPGVVTMFVNASTMDGYNPYRIGRGGIDWEVPDPEDPWANIGYWGDHQIVYLLRLLEATDRFLPGEIDRLLDERCCTYADVPYRIAGYDDLVRDPKATIEFDVEAHLRAEERTAALGADGKLVLGDDGEPVVVTLLEKLLVAALAKLGNFVPGGGIWMNTQRPEWNDANNALVGYGLSMVTLLHLRRFLAYVGSLLRARSGDVSVSVEVAAWLDHVATVLRTAPVDVAADEGDRHRREVLDALGRIAADHREVVYADGLSGEVATVDPVAVTELCDVAIAHLDATIRQNLRPDGLVHSYNLIELSSDGTTAEVRHLPEMLEGQVAALGAGVLTPVEQADLVDALFASDLYRPDQDSFVLAPVRRLPGFLDKNVVPADDVDANPLLAGLVAAGDESVVRRDADGRYRFHPDLTDATRLDRALERLAAVGEWGDLVAGQRDACLDTYERVFGHRAFLGRSGSMYAYEGIGSIYWHMVSKLLLAVQEAASDAADAGADVGVVGRLVEAYDRVRGGLGFNKTAAAFGAIPTDPYSHTPAHAGAQQPGMTGAVKEEILARPRELGVRIRRGEIVVDPLLVRHDEVLDEAATWPVIDVHGDLAEIGLEPGSFGLTICQVPIVVRTDGDEPSVELHYVDGRTEQRPTAGLGPEVSADIFGRTGRIAQVRAVLPTGAPRDRELDPTGSAGAHDGRSIRRTS